MSALSSGFVLASLLGFFQAPTPVEFEVIEDARLVERIQPGYQFSVAKSETMVSIFAGRKSTAGYAVEILGVERKGRNCTVRYRVDGPPADAIVAQVLTYPAAMVRVKAVCGQVKVIPSVPQVTR